MEIVVNHVTRMNGGHVCVAGIDERGRHVRPVLAFGRLTRDVLVTGGGPFGLGVRVAIAGAVPRPSRPEVEDHLFEIAATREVGRLDGAAFWDLLAEHAEASLAGIFGIELARDGRTASLPVGAGQASLGIFCPRARPRLAHDQGKLRLLVAEADLGALSLPITDVRLYDPASGAVHARLAQLLEDRLRRRDALLSVGVGRPWTRNGGEPRHWLQVNNVHLDDNPLWPS